MATTLSNETSAVISAILRFMEKLEEEATKEDTLKHKEHQSK